MIVVMAKTVAGKTTIVVVMLAVPMVETVVIAVMLVTMDCFLRYSECICLSLQQPARMSSGS